MKIPPFSSEDAQVAKRLWFLRIRLSRREASCSIHAPKPETTPACCMSRWAKARGVMYMLVAKVCARNQVRLKSEVLRSRPMGCQERLLLSFRGEGALETLATSEAALVLASALPGSSFRTNDWRLLLVSHSIDCCTHCWLKRSLQECSVSPYTE